MSATVVLSRDIVTSFQPSKVFRNASEGSRITSLDFDDTGASLLTCGEDDNLYLYDCRGGKFNRPVASKKYGCHLARFTHNPANCIYASTKENDTIRYLSLHDNSFIRYFKAHKRKVIGLEISPGDDTFISSSLDGTVRLWDLNSATCHGLLTIPSPAFIAFDPAGVVFAVGCEQTAEILLYDQRNYDTEPFAVFKIDEIKGPNNSVPWSKLEFSNDGKNMLVSTLGPVHYLLDAFTGDVTMRLTGQPWESMEGERQFVSSGTATFSPDGRFIFSGATDNKVYVWDVQSPVRDGVQRPIAAFESKTPATSLAFNPRRLVLATADKEVTLWLPQPAAIERTLTR
ncbi:WD40-repeat-containing domain protein [Limtongia smithiae]|uniref:WD40-repeat-containing domain protein n=1 Tax=Limtongia smithiae TaxID=1125753 RepID=UPI0034CD788E